MARRREAYEEEVDARGVAWLGCTATNQRGKPRDLLNVAGERGVVDVGEIPAGHEALDDAGTLAGDARAQGLRVRELGVERARVKARVGRERGVDLEQGSVALGALLQPDLWPAVREQPDVHPVVVERGGRERLGDEQALAELDAQAEMDEGVRRARHEADEQLGAVPAAIGVRGQEVGVDGGHDAEARDLAVEEGQVERVRAGSSVASKEVAYGFLPSVTFDAQLEVVIAAGKVDETSGPSLSGSVAGSIGTSGPRSASHVFWRRAGGAPSA